MTELNMLLWFIQFCVGFTLLVVVGVPMLGLYDLAKRYVRNRK
jgi:hypothetical protein